MSIARTHMAIAGEMSSIYNQYMYLEIYVEKADVNKFRGM